MFKKKNRMLLNLAENLTFEIHFVYMFQNYKIAITKTQQKLLFFFFFFFCYLLFSVAFKCDVKESDVMTSSINSLHLKR